MSVRLRLRRTGVKNKACYRIVAADSRSPRDGRFIEILGYYDPRREDEKINLERVGYWIANGAKPSKTVASVIKRAQAPPPQPSEVDSVPPAVEEDKEKTESGAASLAESGVVHDKKHSVESDAAAIGLNESPETNGAAAPEDAVPENEPPEKSAATTTDGAEESSASSKREETMPNEEDVSLKDTSPVQEKVQEDTDLSGKEDSSKEP